jgi:hypothetical protein
MNGASRIAAIRSSLLSAGPFAAGVACIFFLNVWPEPASAIGGCAGVVGQLTATPSTIDREATTTAALTWSVDRKSCPAPTVSIERTVPPDHHVVPLSGQMVLYDVTRTTTFVLRTLDRELARATVAVNGDPGLITVSSGKQITADDITKFNQQWMQPWSTTAVLGTAASRLSNLDSSGDTEIGEQMAAMVRMFDLTHDTRYLDHLFDLIQIVLQYRDDRPLNSSPKPTDQIRNKVGLAAWGGGLLDNYGLHSVDEITSSLYAYPIAAFARILAEDPAVRARYECKVVTVPGLQTVSGPQLVSGAQLVRGPQAVPAQQAVPASQATPGLPAVPIKRCGDPVFYANRVLETVEVFRPQIHSQRVGNGVEATLTHPIEYKTRPSKDDCDDARKRANNVEPGSKDRWTEEYNDCLEDRDSAEKPMPHNINLAFSKVLIELSRVLASPFYQQSTARAGDAEEKQEFFSALMPRQQRYFVDHLNPESLKGKGKCSDDFCWWYGEPTDASGPAECFLIKESGYECLTYRIEDTDHGSMDMTYVGLFLRDIDRLRAASARVHEQFSLGSKELQGFARTFTDNIAPNTNLTGGNFRSYVSGDQNDKAKPDDSDNLCDGWLELTRADAKVWDLCREMSLRDVGGQQPYLRIGNHSVLLATKQFLP